ARCETPWGLYPSIPGTYAALTSASVDGETYNYLFTIEAVKPAPVYTQIEAPLDPLDDYRMSVVFNSPAYYLNGQVTWDDISSLGTPSRFYKYVPLPASVSALTVNSDDLLFLQLDMFASTWDDTAPVNSGQIDFSIPIGMDWYTILDNSHSSGNAVRVQGNLITDTYGLADNDDNMSPPQNSIRAWPNPFSEFLRIIVSAPRPNKLYVYNLRGQLVRVLTHLDFHDGVGIYSWDGKDDNANACANGVYYIMTGAGEQSETRKVLLLK
ncbi:MAG TPA: T9SS type A sorting domain-containing protein, partial [Candidatus Cloacimonadota bacterium]|nr:T9SS type A sorting domain-containing protein [Candidatus Cloacimonadota bacterium]